MRLEISQRLQRQTLTPIARYRSNLCDAKYKTDDEGQCERNIGDEAD